MNTSPLYPIEVLERQYSVAIDAQNALALRRSAVVADIGLCLELLIPKINLYAKDTVMLSSVSEDIASIYRQCSQQQLDLHFDHLERLRTPTPYGLAFVDDKRHQSFCWQTSKIIIDGYREARAVGLRFLKDPAALIENRLPKLRSQR